ncbi:hypothetical protein JTB14_035192 [Gonioctena quinquepunctata]|nr:hypothetical protein JTB14_035192 [Gonioctena quinquepunctata]
MSKKFPLCVCLQETHFKPSDTFNLRGTNSYRRDTIPDRRARGGVAIFINENSPSTLINLNTRLQAIAIECFLPTEITIYNIYLPDSNWNTDNIREIVEQLPTPFLIVGDFNSHNPIWGSNKKDARGRNIEEIIDEYNLVILNTGEDTFINLRSQSFYAIDLSLCSPILAPNFNWQFHSSLTNLQLTDNVNSSVEYFTNEIINAATNSIPQANGNGKGKVCHGGTRS